MTDSRVTNNDQTVTFTGFVPIDSGGTARDSHPLPLLRAYGGSTIEENGKTCQGSRLARS
ncbi:hypothetical protein COMA2_60125 [Candidatus Nitrospira nitrificans]|uniref:Uncharacterized protein n=1 Tax=Candidatus Nitrospira nitrificans TaxID=1742973 RepID=A0A0S4LNF8_9BACT|nr:hypothetical protein COMA2_60125 [Candidatus Nitrospira nitrificans]